MVTDSASPQQPPGLQPLPGSVWHDAGAETVCEARATVEGRLRAAEAADSPECAAEDPTGSAIRPQHHCRQVGVPLHWAHIPSGGGYACPNSLLGVGIPGTRSLLTSTDGHRNGRYASYWNAFLVIFHFTITFSTFYNRSFINNFAQVICLYCYKNVKFYT